MMKWRGFLACVDPSKSIIKKTTQSSSSSNYEKPNGTYVLFFEDCYFEEHARWKSLLGRKMK